MTDSPTPAAPVSPDDLLTLRQAADVLGVQVGRVRELVDLERLPGEKDARGWWQVRRRDVDAYAAPRPRRPAPVTPQIEDDLAGYQTQIEEAQRRVDALLELRNRAIVAWNDAGVSVTALARATGMGRQHMHTILAETRARLAEEAANARLAE